MCKLNNYLVPRVPLANNVNTATVAVAASIAILRCRRGTVINDVNTTLGSFNALQRGFENKKHANYVSKEAKSWKHRQALLQELLPTLGDIIGVQECEIGTFEEDFGFMANHGYDYIAPFDKAAVKDPSKRTLAKTATFFKTSKFQLLWSNHRSRTLLTALVHRDTQKVIWHINCHLEGHPLKVCERVSQLKSAFNSVHAHQQKLKLKPDQCNVVVCGDFNCSSDCTAFRYVVKKGLSPSDRDPWNPSEPVTKTAISHPYNMRCVTNGMKTFLGSSGVASSIDFIFVSENFSLTAVRDNFTREQWKSALQTGVPNKWHPSDHFPVSVSVRLL
eukprot:TRINITY_DN1603_c0_g1_i1.p1 TRINITY_DN1603_c0_g1~~TRINITY_DN1603_c0_g1_i1.p1  ORF type:complete len:332 (+),score=33.69 TRINITY_DN1603_c0_g1_i1:46-1041(+)